MPISNSTITKLFEALSASSHWGTPVGYNSMGEKHQPDLIGSKGASAISPRATEDELYFVTLSGLFTLPRLSELGYGDTVTLQQYIAKDLLPARRRAGHYWLRLAEAGAAAGMDRRDADENAAGGLVQLDSVLEGLSNVQRRRIALLFRGTPR